MMVRSPDFMQSTLDGLDARAKELEQKWGVGRLRLIVDDDLRARFDRQREILRSAIAGGDEEQIILHAVAMKRGWNALDAAATEAGAEPLSPDIWECRLPCGDVVAIVRTEAEAHALAHEREVWTVAELAPLIERLGKDTRQIKRKLPGAIVSGIRDKQQPSEVVPFFDDTEEAVADLISESPWRDARQRNGLTNESLSDVSNPVGDSDKSGLRTVAVASLVGRPHQLRDPPANFFL